MDTFWQIAILIGVIGAGSAAAYFIIKAQVPRKNLRAFAKSANLSIYYKNRYSYKLEGPYQSYPFQLSPYFPPVYKKKPDPWTHIQVPMNNPHDKFIWLAKGMGEIEWKQAFKTEHTVQVKHELSDEIEILASDLFFSGILLTDQVKARAAHVFGLDAQMLVYLKGETLGVLLPQGPEWQERWKITAESMQLLSEIKDSLQ